MSFLKHKSCFPIRYYKSNQGYQTIVPYVTLGRRQEKTGTTLCWHVPEEPNAMRVCRQPRAGQIVGIIFHTSISYLLYSSVLF